VEVTKNVLPLEQRKTSLSFWLWCSVHSVLCGVSKRQPLWSSGQSLWLQIQTFGSDSRRYHIFWEVMGLERGPLSLVSTIEELVERTSSGSGLENREYGRRDPSRWPSDIVYPQKLTLTSLTRCGLSVGRVRSRSDANDLFVSFVFRKKKKRKEELYIR
jgi:hypothetical protein